jgi:uncharacterized protein
MRNILIILLIFLLEFYFYKKLALSFKYFFPNVSEKKYKRILTVLIIVLNIYPAVFLAASIYAEIAGIRRPRFPESIFFNLTVVFPFFISMLTIIQSVLIFLLMDIIKLLIRPIYKKNKEKILPVLRAGTLVIIVFFTLYVPARIAYDYFTVSLRETEHVIKGLDESLNGFKIVLIADVQADRYTNRARLQRYIDVVNSTNPDLVLIAGDIISNTPAYIEQAAEYLGKIESKYGVYSCVGDHDNWAYRSDFRKSIQAITDALAKQNIYMYDNEKRALDINGVKIGIAFVTNTYVETVNDEVLDSIVNHSSDYDLNIFLTHQPRAHLLIGAVENNYDLFLAGHTHGGQITFLFPFFNFSPSHFETRYVRGDFKFGDLLMIVNRGLGMSLVPIRYNSTPEVTLITLKAE